MKLSICIVNWNVKGLLENCLDSIFSWPPSCDFEVVVTDNNSKDGTAAMVKAKFPQVKLIENKTNLGFSAGNNQAIRASKGEYVLILNPDTVILPHSVDKLIRFLDEHNEAAVVAPKLLNTDGRLQRSCLGFPTIGAMAMRQLFIEQIWPGNPYTRKYLMPNFKYNRIAEVDQPMGACMLARRKALDEAGLFDERSFMFFDEVDLCFRIKKAGYKIFFSPEAEIIHHGGSSIKKWGVFNLSKHWTRSRNLFFKKNYGNKALVALLLLDVVRTAIIFIAAVLIIFAALFAVKEFQ